MKKLLCAVLALVMILSLTTACSGGNTPSSSPAAPHASGGEAKPADPANGVGPTNENPLSDVRIRQAIAYAIDMDAIATGLYEGAAIPADSLMPNGDWKAPGLEQYKYNPEKAKELLKEAKWDSNRTLDVVYYYGDQQTVDLMSAIQQYLADVGMKMTARKLEGDLSAQLWVAPSDPLNGPSAVDWDMAYGAVGALAPHEYYNRFLGGNSSNSHTPKDDKYDELIGKTNNLADVAAQKEAFMEVQKYENAMLPALPLYYQQVYVLESSKLNRGNVALGNEQFNYDWDIVNLDIEATNGKKLMKTNGAPIEFFEVPYLNPGFHMSTKVLYDHLVVADAALGSFKGQLASEYKVSADGKVFEFVLKDGIKWHDNEPITAADVKWSYEFATKVPALNSVIGSTLQKVDGYKDYIDGKAEEIKGITIDGNKVTFTFTEVDPNALLTFSQLPPLPKKYFDGIDPINVQQAKYFQAPVGSGPFKIKEVKMGDYTTFVPFEGYHDGKAKIEEIQMYPSGESDPNLVKNASAGNVDYAYTKSASDYQALKSVTGIKVTPVDIRYTRLLYINKFPHK
ncbi:ABC transporter substrate-binding protein [Hydrogenoanaerobacterium sp.]|uniref:ABC transporter substrate-binding protein n=1 Tax=Hydrogenoanaerobacterium sp. TaxID=2953763 RepID=UPI00289DACC3|nr:ABC transporter substrate-binding protein [Hydrogenoanaerobacterium sp.]